MALIRNMALAAILALVGTAGAVAQMAPQAPVIHVRELRARPRPQSPRVAARAQAIIAAIRPAQIKAMDNRLIAFGSRSSLSDYHPGPKGTPGATTVSTATRGIVPARAWIVRQFQAISRSTGGRLQVRVDTFTLPKGPRIPEPQSMGDVVATLPGTNPNDKRIFLVSGHYDSIPADFKLNSPGGNDDASGTIVSLECARALASHHFSATIVFLTVEGEEEGLYGSRYEAQKDKREGLDIAGMLNDDIVGGDQTPGHRNTDVLRVFSQAINPQATPAQLRSIIFNSWEDDSPARELARFGSEVAGMYLPGFHVRIEYRPDRFERGGDSASFQAAGYPAVRFTDYHENANHQHVPVSVNAQGVLMGDRGRWISPDYLANAARVNALTLAALASSPLPPAHVYFRGGQAIGTPIRWTPVAGAVRYRVLLRPTASPQWTIRIPAPPKFAPPIRLPFMRGPAPAGPPMYGITIPQSPDNYIIAVVAVDKSGNESLPTLATTPPFRFRGRGRGGRGRAGGGRG
jgi:hypothetical protein